MTGYLRNTACGLLKPNFTATDELPAGPGRSETLWKLMKFPDGQAGRHI